MFIRRTDVEAETPILWPPDTKNWLIWKDPDAGKDWRQEKGMTEHEIVGWHHRLSGHEFEETLGVGEGQRSLVCCSPSGCKESDTTERLSDWNELNWYVYLWPIHVEIWQKTKKFCKAIILQKKIKNKQKRTIPCTTELKRIKYKGINLTDKVKDTYTEKNSTLMGILKTSVYVSLHLKWVSSQKL